MIILSTEFPPYLFNLYQYTSNINIDVIKTGLRYLKKYSNKRFHLALKDFLEENNIKLRSLAGRTNLNYTYFSKLKNREKSPPIKTIELIAGGLGIPPEYFLEYRIS